MAYIGMAYLVMAYIGMAYIVMTYLVMACPVMDIVMAHIVMAYLVTALYSYGAGIVEPGVNPEPLVRPHRARCDPGQCRVHGPQRRPLRGPQRAHKQGKLSIFFSRGTLPEMRFLGVRLVPQE